MKLLSTFFLYLIFFSSNSFSSSGAAKMLATKSKVIAKTVNAKEGKLGKKRNLNIIRSQRNEGCNVKIASAEKMKGTKNEINFVARDINIICRR